MHATSVPPEKHAAADCVPPVSRADKPADSGEGSSMSAASAALRRRTLKRALQISSVAEHFVYLFGAHPLALDSAVSQEEEAAASLAAARHSLRMHAQQLLNQAAEKLERFAFPSSPQRAPPSPSQIDTRAARERLQGEKRTALETASVGECCFCPQGRGAATQAG